MNRANVDAWLARYVKAWESYDPAEIVALFTDDAEYRYHPWDEPVVGAEAIAKSWIEDRDQDDPASWEAHYSCLAVDGHAAVATGYSRFFDPDGGETRAIYDNCFIMRFVDDGRCAAFSEFYMKRPNEAGETT